MSRLDRVENNGSPPRITWCEERRYAVRGAPRGGSGPAYPHMYRYGFPVRGFFGGRGGCLRKSEGLRGCGWLPLAGLYRP